MSGTVADARKALGPVGVCLPVSFTDPLSVDLQREAVGGLERAGYRAVWTNEVIGKDALVLLATLLPAGADHVALLLPIGVEFDSGIRQLEQLAPALAG